MRCCYNLFYFPGSIFGALSFIIITKICKSRARALLEVNNSTFNPTQTMDSYNQQQDHSPISCQLICLLDRASMFSNKDLTVLEKH